MDSEYGRIMLLVVSWRRARERIVGRRAAMITGWEEQYPSVGASIGTSMFN